MQVLRNRGNIGVRAVAVSLAAVFALAAPVLSSSAFAAANPHVSEAVRQKGAASHGRQGMPTPVSARGGSYAERLE